MGIIAQEVLAVLTKHGLDQSGMVNQHKDPERYMSVRYNDLLAPMIKAIQDLSEENQNLKSDIKILENEVERIDALEASLSSIKAMLSASVSYDEE